MIRRVLAAAVVLGALGAGGWFAWTQSQLVRAPGGPWHFDSAVWTQSRDHWRLDVSLSVQTDSEGVASGHFREFDPEFAICEAMLARLPDAPEGVGAGDIYEVGVFLVALDTYGYPARNSSDPVPVMVDNGRCFDRGEGGVFYYNFAPPLSGWLWNGGVGWESSGDEDPIWVMKVFKSVPLFDTVQPFDAELACEDLLGDPRYMDRLPRVPQADTVPMDRFRIEWSPEDGLATGNIVGFATMETQIMAVDGADCTPVEPS